MKIIVESGATKSEWRLYDADGEQRGQFLHQGTNVSSMPMETVRKAITGGLAIAAASSWLETRIDAFYLYTAGVVTDAIREEIVTLVKTMIDVDLVDVEDDLVGAARAVCGSESGVVAIMGTGSNTCWYDGVNVHREVYSGGFILGDDGGAATLGRMFISDYIKNLVPAAVAEDFASKFDASYASIVENVYRGGTPAGYLGSFAPFIVSHYDDPYVKELVDRNFRNFIERSLLKYDGVGSGVKVGVVGGFGYACREIFSRIAAEYGICISCFLRAPIDGLAHK